MYNRSGAKTPTCSTSLSSIDPITVEPRIKPGTRLIQVWQETHSVLVLGNGGFEWNGARHRSLSRHCHAKLAASGGR